MTVEAFAKQIDCKILCMPTPQKEIDSVYVGDLLSWVMGNAEQGNIWITIMSNINVVAVATLVDVSCILLSENVILDQDTLNTAVAKGVNVLSTGLSSYQAAVLSSSIIK